MKTPQEWYIESLTEILKNKNDYIGNFKEDEAYKYVLKSFMDKYSNTFLWKDGEKIKYRKKVNSDIFNMYWESFVPRHYDIICKTIIISKNAYDYLKSISDITNTDKARKKIKEFLHLEHLTPMSYSRDKLIDLNVYTKDEVKKCFKYATVALITKEESKYLDSKETGGCLVLNDIESLEILSKKYKDIEQNEVEEAKDIFEKQHSLKDHGNGLLRLIHLYNNKVVFVDCNGNNINSIEELYARLKDNKFEVLQYQ